VPAELGAGEENGRVPGTLANDRTENREITMLQTDSLAAVYGSQVAAEAAVKQLQKSGFDMTKLSMVGRDLHTEEQVVGYYITGDRVKYWGKSGAFWGGVFDMLSGWAFFWVPAIGPLLVAGPLVALIVEDSESVAIGDGGLSVLAAGLCRAGISKDGVLRYETAIKAGKYLLLVQVTADGVVKAKEILNTTSSVEVSYHRPDHTLSAYGHSNS
jgi:hypothetical protein